MNAAASASYRSAAELGDQDPYPPEREGCVLCGLSALACECADEPEPAVVRDRCINCGAFRSARAAERTDPDGGLWLGYGCRNCGYFDSIELFDRRDAVAAGVASEEGSDDVSF